MTGRQLGYGAGYDSPGYTRAAGGRLGRGFWGRGAGFGPGFGRGFFRRGWGRGLYSGFYGKQDVPAQQGSVQDESEMNRIQGEVTELRAHLNTLMERLDSISSDKNKK
jgi:hypothetical protein